jgi:hypothetical protein
MTDIRYREEIRSKLTSLLFAVLALVFLGLFAWRYAAAGWVFTPRLFLFLFFFFLFYLVNYRTLRITVTAEGLLLRFGLIRWRTDLDNIQAARLDDSPMWIKYGGAGVHFALVRGSYRAFFNFLEHPRVTISLREKQGPVQELCFTTCCPEQVLDLLAMEVSDAG